MFNFGIGIDIGIDINQLEGMGGKLCQDFPGAAQLIMMFQGVLFLIYLRKHRIQQDRFSAPFDVQLVWLEAVGLIGILLLSVALLAKSPVHGAFLAGTILITAHDLVMHPPPELLRSSSKLNKRRVDSWLSVIGVVGLSALSLWLIGSITRTLGSEFGFYPYLVGMLIGGKIRPARPFSRALLYAFYLSLAAIFIALTSFSFARFLCWFANQLLGHPMCATGAWPSELLP